MARGTGLRLLYEKVPLFILSAVSSTVTYIAQKEGEAVASLQHLPFTDRLGNAVVAYATYIGKTILPYHLAVYYTHPGQWPATEILSAFALLLMVTLFCLTKGRRSPFLAVGWFWYLGTLVPVIGLVQVGGQAMADRYTYLPLVGLFILATWGFSELLPVGRYRKAAAGLIIGAVTAVLVFMTQIQVGHWKSSITLFSHALSATKDNFQAHNNLARALTDEKRFPEAEAHFLASMRLSPSYLPPYLNLGQMRMEQGRLEEALTCFSEALKIKPGDGDALFAMGNLYLKEGAWDKAIAQYRAALGQKSAHAPLHNNLGLALTRKGETDEAIRSYQTAIRWDPEHAGAHNNLAMLWMGKGNHREAVFHFRQAIRYERDYWNAHFQLALIFSIEGMVEEASFHQREAQRIKPDMEKLPEHPISEAGTGPSDRIGK
jgi:Tfp pilus assembly protein PilF